MSEFFLGLSQQIKTAETINLETACRRSQEAHPANELVLDAAPRSSLDDDFPITEGQVLLYSGGCFSIGLGVLALANYLGSKRPPAYTSGGGEKSTKDSDGNIDQDDPNNVSSLMDRFGTRSGVSYGIEAAKLYEQNHPTENSHFK